MVRKLMKHELYALFRVLVFFAVAVVVFAVVGRLLIAFNLRTDDAAPLTILVLFFYIATMLGFVFAAWGLGVNRFYRTLFTGEGYMTLSLPATPVQIVLSKLLSAIIMMFFASIVSALSLTIFLVGWESSVMEFLGEIFGEVFADIWEIFLDEPILFLETTLLFIVSVPMSLLAVYAIISVGQLFTSHRKGMTWLLVFAVYIGISIVNTVGFQPLLGVTSEVSAHLAIWIVILTFAAIDVGCFLLVRYILKNKVNLIA